MQNLLERNIKELISNADKDYNDALRLLETGDTYDAAEKAWSAIEGLRKACLIAAKIPYEIAKTKSRGLPLFIKILKALGRKDLLKSYMYFSQQLHSMGFYERVTPESDLRDTIQDDVPEWMQKIKELINILRKVDLSDIIDILNEIDKIKQRILRESSKYLELQQKLSQMITQKIMNVLRT